MNNPLPIYKQYHSRVLLILIIGSLSILFMMILPLIKKPNTETYQTTPTIKTDTVNINDYHPIDVEKYNNRTYHENLQKIMLLKEEKIDLDSLKKIEGTIFCVINSNEAYLFEFITDSTLIIKSKLR